MPWPLHGVCSCDHENSKEDSRYLKAGAFFGEFQSNTPATALLAIKPGPLL